jgi:alpha-glucosidase
MVHQLINLGLSGFAYSGADVGGFTGGPSPELMTRWFELAAFTPIFRDHSAKDTPRAEPWLDGPEQLAIRRRFVEERYRLMPYLYALADQNARTGDPLMRPVFYDYPDATALSCDQSMTFTLGRSLFLAPPPKMESPQSYDVCLPKGGWFDYWTGKAVAGDSPISEKPNLERLPVFVRAGTILPRQPLVQSTSETPGGPLYLDIYPGPDCSGTLYFDDGHSMEFTKGAYLRQTIRCSVVDGQLTVVFEPRQGTYAPWWKQAVLTVHGIAGPAAIAGPNGSIAGKRDATGDSIAFQLPDMPKGGTVVIRSR